MAPLSALLLGVSALTLLDFSASAAQTLQITQKPRFYSVTTNRKVGISCRTSGQNTMSTVTWYKASEFNTAKSPISIGKRILGRKMNLMENATLLLSDLQLEDQGVYFCMISGVFGPGTEVQVSRPENPATVLYRSQMKDALMLLQGLLLALIIAGFVFRKKTLSKKQDFIYEEPDVDHIYEGLAINTCEGADLYEEISVYAQPEGAEAPWEEGPVGVKPHGTEGPWD